MKQKNTLLLTGLLAFAALAPMSAQAHGPKHNDGVRLATDIVNLVGSSFRWLTTPSVVVTPPFVTVPTTEPAVVVAQPAPVVIAQPAPVVIAQPAPAPHRPQFERPHRGPHHARPMPAHGRGGRGR